MQRCKGIFGENGEGTVGQDQIKGTKKESGERENTRWGGGGGILLPGELPHLKHAEATGATEKLCEWQGHPLCAGALKVLGGEAQNLSKSEPCPLGVSSLCGEACKAEFQRSEVSIVEDIFKQRRREWRWKQAIPSKERGHGPKSIWDVRAVWRAEKGHRVPSGWEGGCCRNSTEFCNWTLNGVQTLLPGKVLTGFDGHDNCRPGSAVLRSSYWRGGSPHLTHRHLPVLPVRVSAPVPASAPLWGAAGSPGRPGRRFTLQGSQIWRKRHVSWPWKPMSWPRNRWSLCGPDSLRLCPHCLAHWRWRWSSCGSGGRKKREGAQWVSSPPRSLFSELSYRESFSPVFLIFLTLRKF